MILFWVFVNDKSNNLNCIIEIASVTNLLDTDEASQIAQSLKKSGYIDISGYSYDYSCKITVLREKLIEKKIIKPTIVSKIKLDNKSMDIFISHSSQDRHLVKAMIYMIRGALSISETRIGCTCVDG